MKNIRLHNDLTIDWSITRYGEAVSLEGRDIAVALLHAHGDAAKITWTVSGNVIHVVFLGMDQVKIGKYMLVCTENAGKPNMLEVDHCEAVKLVEHTSEEGGESCSNISIAHVDLSSDVATCQSGASAYEIALRWGFVGSEEDWVKSLKGEPGDKGNKGEDGTCIYPKFSVNSQMQLEIDTEMPTERVTYEQASGQIFLNI